MPSHCNQIWLNGEIVPWDQGQTHVMSHTLHYGTGVFEGIKCYITDHGPAIFRLQDHIKRLFQSADIYEMETPYDIDAIIQGCIELVRVTKIENGYIRPIIYFGYDGLGIHPKNCPVNIAIGLFDWGEYLGEGALEKGINVTISPWRKFHSSSLPTVAKANGQYLNSVLAARDAKEKGFDEALLLNQDGTIAEGAGQNLFIINNDVLYTNAEESSILMGITRDTVIQLARQNGYEVKIAPLSLGQLFTANEVFFSGTASEITPICSVDRRKINQGEPGKITKQLQKGYLNVVHGKIRELYHYLTFVEERKNCQAMLTLSSLRDQPSAFVP
ncbi:MAG: branched-chain amino acid transaminase [Candidatus Marinimicrobia bacterium]|nr:branched-chain amino acid transaminase [Candidatus Neomarinimicrobiota bacterium]